jgi:hypothetical protein
LNSPRYDLALLEFDRQTTASIDGGIDPDQHATRGDIFDQAKFATIVDGYRPHPKQAQLTVAGAPLRLLRRGIVE